MAIRDRSALRAFVGCLAATGTALGLFAATAHAADPSGVWLVADQTARIRIEPCADGYWGSIDWERQPGIDAKNPDPSRRGRPLLGTPILISMKPTQANRWEGRVYNPKEGSFHDVSISLKSPSALRLEGCLLIFCGGETWTRVSDEPRSTTGAATQTPSHSVCPGAPAQRRH